jgi:hypothetical protein
VTLTVLRQGERTTVKAKLAEMDVAVNNAGYGAMNTLMLNRAGAPMAVTQLGEAINPVAGINDAWAVQVAAAPRPGKMFVQNVGGKQRTQWSDAEHELTLDRDNGKTMRLKAVELKTGKVLFEGAVDTDEQRKGVPAELLKKVEIAEATAAQPFGGKVAAGGGFGGRGFGIAAPTPMATGRGKVLQWQDDNAILMLRTLGKTPTYLMALSKKDGHIIFDGPVQTDEQRKSLPPEIAEQFEMLVNKPDLAKEFGAPEGGGGGGKL